MFTNDHEIMSEVITIIKDWPIIVQGALGSALFWLFLVISQKIAVVVKEKLSKHSRESRLSRLRNEYFKYSNDEDAAEHSLSVVYLIYRSLRPFLRAMMWFVMGVITNIFASPLGVIGYIGALFLLFN